MTSTKRRLLSTIHLGENDENDAGYDSLVPTLCASLIFVIDVVSHALVNPWDSVDSLAMSCSKEKVYAQATVRGLHISIDESTRNPG